MAQRAFILGGTGQVGRAVVDRLTGAGWTVVVASRGLYPHALDRPDQVRVVTLDRNRPRALEAGLPDGVCSAHSAIAAIGRSRDRPRSVNS